METGIIVENEHLFQKVHNMSKAAFRKLLSTGDIEEKLTRDVRKVRNSNFKFVQVITNTHVYWLM